MMDRLFATAAPGLEGLVAEELHTLGLLSGNESAPVDHHVENSEESGGVEFTGDLEAVYRANLHLRTASRVLVRLGEFYAAAFSELRKKAGRLAWERHITPGQPIVIHAACHRSKLYHSDAVAERVAGAIGDRLGKPSELLKPVQAGEGAQLIVVRLLHDQVTISVDSSGELLHRRGYRLATAKAPLRETLAAALLMLCGWDAVSPLLDPFCGSGTIPIEAALLAVGIPPGINRSFAFMRWPGYDVNRWQTLKAEVRPAEGQNPILQASDRDAGAIELAKANAARAGVEGMIEFTQRAVSAIEPPPQPGWVITNPPYGMRVSAGHDLRNLYAQLGHVLRRACPGWLVGILSSDQILLVQTGLRLDTRLTLVNGGVAVKLGRGRVPSSSE